MFKISNAIYDGLKKVAIVVPLIGTFYATIAMIWGLPYGEQVSATALAVETLLVGYITKAGYEYGKAQNATKIDDTNGAG